MVDRCVCCDAVIPEGVQVCYICQINSTIGGLQMSVEDMESKRLQEETPEFMKKEFYIQSSLSRGF